MAELSVQIGADINDLIKKLDLTEKQLKELEASSRKAGISFDRNLSKATSSVANLGNTTKGNAVPALNEFSRVIQDAPYGIQGVANNITQLTTQFGYLSKNAGGTKAALKAMVGTLTGPAGILLAISAVTSLMVSYGDEMLNLISGNDALAKSQKEVNKALNEFYGTSVTQAQSYVTILEDVNSTENQRINAQKELMKIIPTITENDFKQANALDLVKNKLYEYVGAQAARIEADKIVEGNSEELAKQARIRTINAIKDEKKKSEAIKKFLKEEGVREVKQVQASGTFGSRKRSVFADKTIEDFKNDFQEIEKEVGEDLKEVNQRLTDLFQTATDLTPKQQTSKTSGAKKTRGSAKKEKIIDKDALFKQLADEISGIEADARNQEFARIDLPLEYGALTNIEKLNKELSETLEVSKLEIEQWGVDLANAQKKALESVAPINQALTDTFRAMFSEITNMISTGNAIIDAFVSSIINSLSTLLTNMITSLIAEKAIAVAKVGVNKGISNSNAITTATSAAAAMGPFGAAALPGLIASQLALVNGAFAGIQAFAKGGFSGDNNLAWLNRDELVLRPTEMATLYNAIRGNNLSSLAGNGGGRNQEVFISKTVLRGSDQVIQYNRANKRMSRNY